MYEDDWDRPEEPHVRQETPSQDEEEEEEEDHAEEDVQELEEGEENLMINTKPRFEPCPEDDDFLAALDKMVNENIAESKNVGKLNPVTTLSDD